MSISWSLRRRRRKGQGYAEYGSLLVMIALSVHIATLALGTDVEDFYFNQSNTIRAAAEGGGAPEEP